MQMKTDLYDSTEKHILAYMKNSVLILQLSSTERADTL